jgi:acetyl esterase/lipase
MADPDSVPAQGRDPEEVLTRPAAPPARTTAYGPEPAQVYDVRLPPDGGRDTTVVVVHGGFWRAAYDRAHAASQAQALADAGYAVAAVEYRRTGMPGGGWPGTAEDVAAAVAAVRGDRGLPDRCVLVGHSAGGQLVAWAAAQPWAEGIAGVVSLAGVVDLGRAQPAGVGNGAIDAFMGGTPAQVPERYAAADPARLPRGIPLALLHGTDDVEVPVWVSRSYVDHAPPPHAEMTHLELEGVGHYELIDPLHPAFREVLAAVEWLAS